MSDGSGSHGSAPANGHDESPDNGDLGFDLPAPAKASPARLVLVLGGVAVVLVAAFAIGWLPRHQAKKDLEQEAKATADSILRVQLVVPKSKSSDRAMELPGSVMALEEATIYPRASGYLRTWKVDLGDKVAEGALLAEIDTPEVDQQLAQAKAELARAEASLVQARANKAYSQTTLDRMKDLAPKGVASQQELDKSNSQAQVDEANVDVAQANIEAQKANIRRLAQMQGFSRITAPFAGTITSRTVERGALVSPTTAMFKLSQAETVRVFVQVPQDVAPTVKVDQPAGVKVREYAGRTFEGKVARAAGALDPMSRTMNTEIRVPNPKSELLAGMYAQVSLTLPSPHRVWEVPATAVMTGAKGIHVAIVDGTKIHLVPVTIERDNGATMELATGLEEGDKVVKLGSSELTEGRTVEIAQ